MRTRMPCGVALALALSIASPSVSRAADPEPGSASTPGRDVWRDAKPPDGSFSVQVPGDFEATADDGPDKQGIPMHSSGVRANVPGAMGGNVTYVANCNLRRDDARSAQQRVEESSAQWFRLATPLYRKPIEQGGGPGVEFQIKDDRKVLRARIFAPPDGRTCTLALHWPPFAKPSDAAIERFLDSFRLAKR